MKDRDSAPALAVRLAVVALLAGAMAMTILLIDRNYAPARSDGAEPAAVVDVGYEPPAIAREARRFRLIPRFASDTTQRRRDNAHPRTLATFRSLRAYPGAPPRVPHGLTAEEYRDVRCGTCHLSGGYSPRFGAYAPVAPHPEQSACLQCHLVDPDRIGMSLPGTTRDADCRQCHAPSRAAAAVATDWRGADWPAVGRRGALVEPPSIPHETDSRANCHACHAGPGAVLELRTRHADRIDCRMCHLETDRGTNVYSRRDPPPTVAESNDD